MPEDNHNLPNDEDNSESSPSAMFLEMMRQAAMRDTDGMPPIEDSGTPPFENLEFRVASDDAETQQHDEVDTYYIPEDELFPDAEPSPNDVRPEPVVDDEPVEHIHERLHPVEEQEQMAECQIQHEPYRRQNAHRDQHRPYLHAPEQFLPREESGDGDTRADPEQKREGVFRKRNLGAVDGGHRRSSSRIQSHESTWRGHRIARNPLG